MSGYIIHFDNETELAHYGVKGMKWKKGKKSAKPDSVRDIQRKRRMNKYQYSSTNINRRVKAFEKKHPGMYKAQPKQRLYGATIKRVGTAEIADFGRIGATANTNLFTGKWVNSKGKKVKKVDKIVATKIIKKANNKRYKAQTNVIQRGMDKFASWVNKKKNHKKTSVKEKLGHW